MTLIGSSEIEELVEALKPFAYAAGELAEDHQDKYAIWQTPAAMCIEAGDLRRASNLLKSMGVEL